MSFSKHTIFLAVLLTGVFLLPAHAHTVFLFLDLEDDGQLRIETGFSDGGTGGGLPIEIRDEASGGLLQSFPMPENGVARAAAPVRPYTVTLDAGEGHRVTKPGPLPKAVDAPAKPLLLDCHWGDWSSMPAATQESLRAARVVVAHEWLFERLKPAFTDQTVVLVDADVPLAAEGDDAAARKAAGLRAEVRARIEAAVTAGQSVVVLCAEAGAPDWSWLAREAIAVPLEVTP